MLTLFTVIALSWAIFVQAWKVDFVAIYGTRAILGHLCADLDGDRAILGHLSAGSEGRFCRYLR